MSRESVYACSLVIFESAVEFDGYYEAVTFPHSPIHLDHNLSKRAPLSKM
jgi:hypothetical protein